MNKKILHIIFQSSYDGAVRVPLNIIVNTPDFFHSFISVYKSSAAKEIEEMQIPIDHLLEKKYPEGRNRLKAAWRLIAFLLKNRFDIVHYHQGGFSILLISFFLKKRAKFIHHFHSADLYGKGENYETPLIHKIILKGLKNYTIKIALSDFIKLQYQKMVGVSDKLFIIKNGTSSNFRPKKEIMHQIGYLGRINKLKGSEILDSLAKELTRRKSGLNLLLKGDAYSQLDDSKNIRYLLPSFDVEQFFNEIDLLIFPSLAAEGSPMVVIESFANNIPVIAFNNPALEDLSRGYPLFIDFNSKEPVKLIIDTIEEYYKGKYDLSELKNYHCKVSEEHSMEKMISGIRKIYG